MSRLIQDWQLENPEFWQNGGRKTAWCNLWISIPALMLALAIWQVWSATVTHLPRTGLNYSSNQPFWLVAVPTLSGATFHAFYSFMVSVFGGRRWMTFSITSLPLPAVSLGMAIQNPDIFYGTMSLLALLCDLDGADFPSSMANISLFSPKAGKGTAMGLNAGLGNLGVSAAQLVVPLVITVGLFGTLGGGVQTWTEGGVSRRIWLQNAGFMWASFIIAPSLVAWFGTNDLAPIKADFAEQAVIFKRKHNWVMCFVYLGASGSFLGFPAGLSLLIQTVSPAVNPVKHAFLGPLIGALTWPFGGWIADKTGSGAKITQWVFIGMIAAVFGVLSFLPSETQPGGFWGLFACFMILLTLSGIDDGSTLMQIPVIFLTLHQRRMEQGLSDGKQVLADAAEEGAAVAGFTGAFAAYDGLFIPKSYGTSIMLIDSVNGALYGFTLFYLCCLLSNWWYYVRRNAEVRC